VNAAGYSGTPLPKKLGIKADSRVVILNEPPGFRALLVPLPEGVEFAAEVVAPAAFVHLFATSTTDLTKRLKALRKQLMPDGTLWVSWPKKSSGVKTDISEDVIRDAALPLGFVDVKVCAIDATWSGLKLVIRKSNRPKGA
jgi:hypothetical protein